MTINNSFKRWYEHLLDSVNPPWAFFGRSFAVFATLWTLIEANSFFGNEGSRSLQNGSFYLYLIGFSALSGFALTFVKHMRTTPSFAEGFPKEAQRIIRNQAKGWEFHLAQVLFVSLIEPLDRRLEGILNGTALVLLRPAPSQAEYMSIISLRTGNMIRMASVAKHMFEVSFPGCFEGKLPVEERVKRIQKAVQEVESFYEVTISMEEELHSMGIPDGFEKLHEMQANWTEAIRVPFRELLRFLQAMRDAVNSNEENPSVHFSLVMEPPQNIDAFNEEVSRLSALYCRRF